MHNERNIKNNLTYYLNKSSSAASALLVVVGAIREAPNKKEYEKCIEALNFLSDEIYTRCMAVDDLLEDGELDHFMSDKDIYHLLAERKKMEIKKED
ncbi:hypothetical protein AA471_27115 [Salmonella enterica subsp. enterica]|nr:hypothetical protein [Salmonella enterica subsp. enterica]ECI0980898.1 hypothetical protein [Salmonella enterica subsp. enterica serovar Newport]ECO0902243.1 hypothetical protein [Salmonella enterica subsp. enterica serovar Newport]ECO1013762.1 hypothetical protein [Salmonella enterica subsp. enterica serovar Newport]EDQ2991771.1 hypothetical protein [Salmonella enterica subsp. enterica]